MSERLQAARALAAVLRRDASLASALPAALDKLPVERHPLVRELCYGSCRYLPRLQLIAGNFLQKPLKRKDLDVQALVLIGIYQLLMTRIPAHAAIAETVQAAGKLKKPWAKGLVNGVLRNLQRQGEPSAGMTQDPVYQYAHPRWLIDRLRQAWPDRAESILEQNNHQGPMTLRVNRRRGLRDAYLARLQALEIAGQPGSFSPDAITLEAACDVDRLPGFRDGDVSVQDEAAQLAAGLLALTPGQRVLDACAAPGGKTGHMLESEPGLAEVLALDLSPERLDRVRENLDRLALDAALVEADASSGSWWDGRPFDRILLDAPCSATGVIRRNPDIKYLRTEADIDNLATLQQSILENLWTMLKPGGRLVYATCSVLPDENEKVVAAFLAGHPDSREILIDAAWGNARPAGRQLFPQHGGHDGFYYAVLEKSAETAP